MHERFSTTTTFLDLFLTISIVTIILFILSFLLINVSKKNNEGVIVPEAKYMMVIEWSQGNYDVDLWVRDPNEKVLSFVSKEQIGMNLERDDLGDATDIAIDHKTGKEIILPINREVVSIRAVNPGKYHFNVHYYKGNVPIKIKFEFIQVSPYKIIHIKQDIELTEKNQEKTIFSIEFNPDGTIKYFNDDEQVRFVHGSVGGTNQ